MLDAPASGVKSRVPSPASLPPVLVRGRRWVAWKLGKRPGTKPGKLPKVPINPRTGQPASPTDPETWGDFSEATDAVHRWGLSGLGRMIEPSDGLSFIDLDRCRNAETGRVNPWAEEILATISGTYAELSPSGTGFHLTVDAIPPKGAPCRRGSIELYSRLRYMTVTGDRLDGRPLVISDGDRLPWFVERYLGKPSEPAKLIVPAGITLDDAELLKLATGNAKNGAKLAALLRGDTTGYPSASEADLALARLLAFWFGADADRIAVVMRASEARRDKWDDRPSYLARTIQKAIGGTPCTFTLTSLETTRKYNTCVSKECPTFGTPRLATISRQLDALFEHIRRLRHFHGRPIGLSVRQAAGLCAIPRQTAARRLDALIASGRLVLVTKGTNSSRLSSEYDLPEFAPSRSTSEAAALLTASLPPSRTPGGLLSVYRWSAVRKAWQHFGDCIDQESANALAAQHMRRMQGFWSVGGELRHFVRGRGLRIVPANKWANAKQGGR